MSRLNNTLSKRNGVSDREKSASDEWQRKRASVPIICTVSD